MADKLFNFDPTKEPTGIASPSIKVTSPKATSNPYDPASSPADIFNFLPPDGSKFGLYADPFATMVYVQPNEGKNRGRYWINQRMEEQAFTDNEIALISFLSNHRVATRAQITRIIFSEDDNPDKVKDFIKKCRTRGIITAFSWMTPCNSDKKKPLIYGLTRIGCEASEALFHQKVPKDFQFVPVDFSRTSGPNMSAFFPDLVANELYAEMKRIDRILYWDRKAPVRLQDGSVHYPGAVIELIKDSGQFLTFWLEVIRLSYNWEEHAIKRFKYTQAAIEKLPLDQQPKRLIIIVDSDSRIPYIAKLADEYLPSIEIRWTTDERLLMGLSPETFLIFDSASKSLKKSKMSFLLDGHTGMTASEYFELQQTNFEDDDFED